MAIGRNSGRDYGRAARPPAIARLAAGWLAGGLGALALPGRLPGEAAFAAAAVGLFMLVRGRALLAGGLLAASLTAFVLGAGMDDRLEARLDGSMVEVTGVVDDLVREEPRRRVLTLRTETPAGLPRRVRLAWYEPGDAVLPAPGERWTFLARLRRPRGLANPGGMDWEGWLLRAGIGATGYASGTDGGRRVATRADPMLAFRAGLASKLRRAAGADAAADVLVAITTGLGSAVTPALRDVLSRTGTGHLLAISGLHVGLAAGLAATAAGLAARVARARMASGAAALAGVAFALAYAVVAGAPVSARRAVIMLGAGVLALVLRRRPGAVPVLALAWVLVAGTDPLSPLDPGLWLSFGAVAGIAWAATGRLAAPGQLGSLVRLQAVLSLAMLCLAGPWFSRVSVVSPLANLLAVPWFSIVVIPSALGGALLLYLVPPAGEFLVAMAAAAVRAAFPVLEALAAPDWAAWPLPEAGPASVACGAVGVAWLTAPRPAPVRPLALCLLAPLVLGASPGLRPGEFRLQVLDVGQGLAVVVRTARAAVVYDAGPAWPGGDAGRSTVVPALRALGVSRLNVLVLSHGDSDHAGGGAAVAEAMRPGRVLVGPGTEWAGAEPCAAGKGWVADGVSFRFLAPGEGPVSTRNDGSCVLLVEGAGGRALLTGDIEAAGEAGLLRRGERLAADVVVAPHHGSRSSSGRPLVEATRPAWAVFAAGWRNRWGFPHGEVVKRWRGAGALPRATDRAGALEFTFRRSGPVPPSGRRERGCRAWRDCGRVAGPRPMPVSSRPTGTTSRDRSAA